MRIKLAILVSVLVILGSFLFFSFANSTPFQVVTSILGTSLEGVKPDEIPLVLSLLEEKWKAAPLTIQAGEKIYQVDKKNWDIKWEIPQMKNLVLKKEVQTLPIVFSWDEKKVENTLYQIAQEAQTLPQDAYFVSGRIIPSIPGRKLNIEKAKEEIQKNIEQGEDQIILHSFQEIPPAKSTQLILEEVGLGYQLSRFQTSLAEREPATIFNIKLACSAINGIVLSPGEIFSFNQLVGKAEKEDGYQLTQVYANGQLTPGYGGGICQVSSTLYNAILYTEAKVIERHPHSGYSATTSYVPPGRDAAVSYGFKDFCFSFPQQSVAIFAFIQGEELTAEIWGEQENDFHPSISTKLISYQTCQEESTEVIIETSIWNGGKKIKSYQDRYLTPCDMIEMLKENY
ncbi:MAG: hypothetical protein PWP04_1565 [Candidatus Atribacteria bacterium]|nr:hypothetical protein [Candidatus Atribacteria bacterium]